jgi:hypothetical protein
LLYCFGKEFTWPLNDKLIWNFKVNSMELI